MNIIEAIKDPNLFQPFLGDLPTWRNWVKALRVLYGLPITAATSNRLVRTCMGRDAGQLQSGFDTALFLTGRRSGKSRIAAVIGAYEAILAGHEDKLAPGENGVVAICAPSKQQGRIVRNYLRAIFDVPLLHQEVVADTKEGFELKNGTRIEILAGDFRTIRGYTLIAAIVDEAAFFGHDADSKIRSDSELIRAIQPSLATVGGKLICISSPYAKRGWCYQQFKKHHGNDQAKNFVWNCPSRTMNPCLPQSVVEEALAEDPQAARAEYLGEFRDDVSAYLSEDIIRRYVYPGRTELLSSHSVKYHAFVDMSGGRSDSACLAIAHMSFGRVVVDLLREYKPPFSPYDVVYRMADVLKDYGVRRVVGDNYSAEFVTQAFADAGLRYAKSDKSKSELYLELLPHLLSNRVELLDNDRVIKQLANLERRTRSGGRDIIDHSQGQHDDLANALAGVVVEVCTRQLVVGAITLEGGI